MYADIMYDVSNFKTTLVWTVHIVVIVYMYLFNFNKNMNKIS